MGKTASYTEARANLASLWDLVIETHEPLTLHRRGARDVVLIAADEFEGLLETAHLLRSPRNAKRLFVALNRAKRKRLHPASVEDLRREFGLGKAD